jgi:hypothetical protein
MHVVEAHRQEDPGTWFDALAHMKAETETRDFDICIIGAGAYGSILAAHAKAMGRKAVALCGATQILFGIRGKRWDERDDFAAFFNEHRVRPKPSEMPQGSATVEGGCYW